MDIALKQRLIGATVLVAAGVVFIPMILDGSAQRAREGLPEIPQRPDMNFETRRLALDPEASVATSPSGETSTRESSPGDTATRADPSDSQIPEVVVVNPVISEPLPTTESAPRDNVPSAVVETPDEPPTASADTPSGGSSAAGDEVWTLQLGSFGLAENADGLVARVAGSGQGLSAYSEPVPVAERMMYRVRAGAFATRDEAVEAGARLGDALPDVEISLRRVAGEVLHDDEPGVVGFMVQVGFFASESNASSLRDQLRDAGYRAHIDRIDNDGRVRYRVRVGPEIERAGANAIRTRIQDEFSINGIVVSHP